MDYVHFARLLSESDLITTSYLCSKINLNFPLSTEEETRIVNVHFSNYPRIAGSYISANNQIKACMHINLMITTFQINRLEETLILLDHFFLRFLFDFETSAYANIEENRCALYRLYIEDDEIVDFLQEKYIALIKKTIEPNDQKKIKIKLMKLYIFSGDTIKSDELLNELILTEPKFQDYKEKISGNIKESTKDKFKLFETIFVEPKMTTSQLNKIAELAADSIYNRNLENELCPIQLMELKHLDSKQSHDKPSDYDNVVEPFISFLMNNKLIEIRINDCKYIEDKDYYVYCSQQVLDWIEDSNLKKKFADQLNDPHFADKAQGKNGIKYLDENIFEVKIAKENARIFGFLTKAIVTSPEYEDSVEIKLLYFNEYKTNGHSPHVITEYKAKVKNYDAIVFRAQIKYYNSLLNNIELMQYVNSIGGFDALDKIISLSEDPSIASILIDEFNVGNRNAIKLALGFEEQEPSEMYSLKFFHYDDYSLMNDGANNLKEQFDFLSVLRRQLENFMVYRFLIGKIKSYALYEEIFTFKDLLVRNNIPFSLDILNDPSSFKKQVLLKLHPDKGGNPQDFILAQELQAKLKGEIDVSKIINDYLNNNLHSIQEFIYKISIGFKTLDTAVDSLRFTHEPTIDNAKSVIIDSSHLYGMYHGLNGLSIVIATLDTSYKIYQGKYLEAGKQFTSATAFMALPLIIKNSLNTIIPENKYISPLTGIAYGGLVGLYSGYSTVKNTYSLYDELFNSKDNNIRSLTAYKDLSDLLSKTYLQSIYDFKEEAIKYEISINNINLDFEKLETKQNLGKNKGEFGKKLYQYIYKPSLEEKYDLLNKVTKGVITEEERETLISKYISLHSNEINYDHCMEIKQLKDWQDLINNQTIENEEHYYCYNTQEEILDHVSLITMDGVINNFEIVEHL